MAQGMIRIIGGEWRGRKLAVPNVPHLRPTPDRVRETLFNWLAPVISGAYCLDAFAGSGVLGFEACSRGAVQAVLVDASPVVIKLLQEEVQVFKASNIMVYQALVPQQLKVPTRLFDIVFLDPPYQSDALLSSCFYLEEKNFLADEAYIYLEARETIADNQLPTNWQLLKSKRAGDVAYHLVLRKK